MNFFGGSVDLHPHALLPRTGTKGVKKSCRLAAHTALSLLLALTGRADAAWCADSCLLYLQRTPHPADGVPGHVVVDAGDLIRWGYGTGVVLITRAGFADEEPGFLERFIAKVNQAAYDYRAVTAPGRSAPWANRRRSPARCPSSMRSSSLQNITV